MIPSSSCVASVSFRPDGTVQGLDPIATRLVLTLDLNSPRLVEWRVTWMRILALAAERDRPLLLKLAGFPADLPDLARLRPPVGNSRPEGIAQSWAAIARRGELPDLY